MDMQTERVGAPIKRFRRLVGCGVVGLVLAAPLWGTAQAQPAPPTCTPESHRHFDFWVGEWTVVNRLSQNPNAPPSQSEITSQSAGCVILERWQPDTPRAGTSISFFNRRTGTWQQDWVGSNGVQLLLVGELEDGAMVLWSPEVEGQPRSRVTWTPNEDGTVRQLWEQTTDGGENWTPVFDGLYSPVGR